MFLLMGGVIAVAAVVILALVLVIVLLVHNPRSEETVTAPTTSSSSPPETTGSSSTPMETDSPEPTDVPTTPDDEIDYKTMDLTVGGGGSKKAADGTTPIGYEPSCRDAAQAATNYEVGLDPLRAVTGEISEQDYYDLIDQTEEGDIKDDDVENAKSTFDMKDDLDPHAKVISHLEWGGYSIADCEAGKSAEVWMVGASGVNGTSFEYAANGYELEWVDGDWRITAGVDDVQPPVGLPEGTVTGPDQKVLQGLGNQGYWGLYVDDE
jgi:hypothetical protein